MKLHRVHAGVFQSFDERFTFRHNRDSDSWSIYDAQSSTPAVPLVLDGESQFRTLAYARAMLAYVGQE